MDAAQWNALIHVLAQIAEALGKIAGAIIISAILRASFNK